MKSILITSTLLLAFALAAEEHRHEGAHVHGAASLGVVVEGKVIHFEFEAPAENIIGFEYEPKTAADRAKQKAGLDKIRNNIASLLKLNGGAACRITIESLEWKKETHAGSGTHSVVEGDFKAECNKPAAGTTLRTAFTQFFPSLEKLEVTVISGDKQNAVVIQKDKGSVEL